jgi:restriction system protein
MCSENLYLDLLIRFAIQYWWVLLLLFVAWLIMLFAPIIKGRVGEGAVNLAAKLRLDSSVYHLIKDVTIPTKRGSTQIDHVIVSKFGLFVIETKNYKGCIFADANSAKWTQVNFKHKNQFQNPVRQNYAHICALAELLELPKDKIIGVVCFMGDAKFKNGVPEGVFLEGRYVNHIKSFQTPVFSAEEVAGIVRQIESGRLERGFKTNREHVQRLRHQKSEVRSQRSVVEEPEPSKNDSASNHSAKKFCPACGAEMILRTAKRGANAGNQFWGCSTYPKCRGIVQTT